MMQATVQQKMLIQWCGRFWLANIFLLSVIAAKYISLLHPEAIIGVTTKTKLLVYVFIGSSFIGYYALLASLPLLCCGLLAGISGSRWCMVFAMALSACFAVFILFDAQVYSLYHFHLNGIIFTLIYQGLSHHIFDFTYQEYLLILLGVALVISFEIAVGAALWCCRYRLAPLKIYRYLGFFIFCLYLAFAMLSFSAGRPVTRVFTDNLRIFPFVYPVLARLLHQDQIALERLAETEYYQPQLSGKLIHYPLISDLHCHPSSRLNMVLIVIDSWRFDALTAEYMPQLTRFANQHWRFQRHNSGGNATGAGIFSLFYSVPATYWNAMLTQHVAPVLLDELVRAQYQMGIFASASLAYPNFHDSIFIRFPQLPVARAEKTPYLRDLGITQDFKQFIAKTKNPFFSFLFYDAAHSYCNLDKHFLKINFSGDQCNHSLLNETSNPQPYLNRYHNALVFIDQQITAVLKALQEKNLLNSTVVLITGDHGEEFNDNHLGYWGHASNYTRFQVQTPLVLAWPGSKPELFTHQTNHFDIVPTLLNRVLGCRAEMKAYSMGRDLLDEHNRSYTLVGSYIDYGIVDEAKITRIYPLGNYEIDGLDGHELAAPLDVNMMKHVFADQRRFYQQRLLPASN